MKLRLIASFVLFIGSYLPLSLILLAQDFRYDLLDSSICLNLSDPKCVLPLRNTYFSVPIFFVCLLCFCISLLSLKSVEVKTPIDVDSVEYVPAELMSYTLPYVVSFMSLDYQETGKFVGLLVFLAWIFLITYRSGQLILNPLLIVFGWRLYQVKYKYAGGESLHSARVLSNVQLLANNRYLHNTIQDVMIIKEKG